jgi:hypothetical protein
MDFTNVIFILVIFVFILILYSSFVNYANDTQKLEGFDTYRNHDIGAYDVYRENDSDVWQTGFKPSNIEQANRYANYTWSEKDPVGMTVYDKYYEDYTFEIGGANERDQEYSYRDIGSTGEDNVYDAKFSISDGGSLIFAYGPQQVKDMIDYDPAKAYDFHENEMSIISQKNY